LTKPDVRIRQATPADARAVADIWHAGWPDGHRGHVPDELVAVRTETSFRRRAAERVADTVVAEVGGSIAGFTMVVDDEVEQIYVAASYRGSGLADALLEDAEGRIAAARHSRATPAPGGSTNAGGGSTMGRSSTPPKGLAARSMSRPIDTSRT
jgi:GNAT superfamily N-acetyltransferase